MKTILFACGGTGGHIYPALALAEKLLAKEKKVKIIFGGRVFGMERDLLQGKFEYFGIDAKPLRRGSILQNMMLPVEFLKSLIQAKKIIREQKVNVVVATGGYVTLPYLIVAQYYKLSTYLQEQNLFAGIANKIASKKAKAVFTPEKECAKFFPKSACYAFGNPVRNFPESELDKPVEYKDFAKVILAVGGSQGARGVNREIKNLLRSGELAKNILVYWQSGPIEHQELLTEFDGISNVKLVPFIRGIYPYFAHADLIVSRAGASTLAELALLSKPSVLIPFPHAAENHQVENAKAFEKKGAAKVFLEGSKNFTTEILQLLNDQELIENMGKMAGEMGHAHASDLIIDKIIELEDL